MAVVLVTPLARQDLGDIWDYAAESDIERADRRLPDGRWPTKSLMRSPRYTTRLKDVLHVA